MKKYLIALVALLVVVTGCGNTKKLNCTMEEDGTKGVMNMEFDKEDNLTKLTLKMTEEFETELTKEEVETYKGVSSIACAAYNADYTDCKVDVTSKALELEVVYNVTKMTDEQREEEGFTKEATTFEAMKKDAEDTGFTCK